MSGLEDFMIKVYIKCKEQVDTAFCLLTKAVSHLFSTPPQVESSNSY